MEQRMLIAGVGGQGVMVTGKILGYAASDLAGKPCPRAAGGHSQIFPRRPGCLPNTAAGRLKNRSFRPRM